MFTNNSSDIRTNLHWPPLHKRIEFRTCTLNYKCLHNTAPLYLSEFLHPVSTVLGHLKSSLNCKWKSVCFKITNCHVWPTQFHHIWSLNLEQYCNISNYCLSLSHISSRLISEIFCRWAWSDVGLQSRLQSLEVTDPETNSLICTTFDYASADITYCNRSQFITNCQWTNGKWYHQQQGHYFINILMLDKWHYQDV